MPVAIFETSRDGRITAANAAFRALALGDDVPNPHTVPWANAHPGDRAASELAWRQASEADTDCSIEFRVWHRDGRLVWVHLTASPQRDELGRTSGYVGLAVDDTLRNEQRLLLDRLLGVVESSSDAVMLLDRNGAPLFTNRAAEQLFGVEERVDLIRDPAVRGLLQTLRDQVPRELMSSIETAQWQGEVVFRGGDGLERTLDVDLLIHRGHDGVIGHWGAIARDVTSRNHVQKQLVHQATHDALTGLPNRTLLLRGTADAIDRIRSGRGYVAMIFFDLDRLKNVNDNAGHDVGDALLVQVANRLAQATRPSDLVARIGGDEFVILCSGVLDAGAALDVAERVRQSLAGTVMVRGIEVELSVSIGVALTGASDVDQLTSHEAALTLLRNSDEAMYAAKRRGRSRCELFTEAMQIERNDQRSTAADLERALANDELRLVYQPVISTQTGKLAGAEALLRWMHPHRGQLVPAQFLHHAIEAGSIVPIGDWVLEQVCTDTEAWLAAGLVDRRFSAHINVSHRQLAEGTFVERVLSSLRRHELHPTQLTIDVDEATVADANTGTSRSLQALRRAGVRIALDDFGVGVASLTALRHSGADLLKLDGSLAGKLGGGEADDPIVRAIVQLAHALDMQVVAEWVTTPDQLQRLRAMGCDLVQGHLLGEPTCAQTFADRTGSSSSARAEVDAAMPTR